MKMTPYERVKEWRKANKERYAKIQSDYYIKNKERISARRKELLQIKNSERKATTDNPGADISQG